MNEVLCGLSAEFEVLYSPTGRPSIPPEQLPRALLSQAFHTIRSERHLMEQLDFNLLFRWFVGLGLDEAVWDATVFRKNRERFLEAEVSARFLKGVIEHPKERRLLSRDHFSVDGTLIEAWASMKSFRPKDGGSDVGGDGGDGAGRDGARDFHGETRSNENHQSTTDADARLYRKGNGTESRLCYIGHAPVENRNGLVVCGAMTLASGTAEREAALEMIDRHRKASRRVTLGTEEAYDVADFVTQPGRREVTPHIAVQDHPTKTGKRRKTKIDRRTTRRIRYQPALPQARRGGLRLDEVQAAQAKARFRGQRRVAASFILSLAAYNLVRLPKLLGARP